MKTLSTQELIDKKVHGEYLYVEGYCHYLRPAISEEDSEDGFSRRPYVVLSDNEEGPFNNKNSIRVSDVYLVLKLFRKFKIKKGRIRILTKLIKGWDHINNVMKIELLDEQDKVIDFLKAHDSSIPKELKDKI